MPGSDANNMMNGKVGELIFLFETLSNTQEIRKPHTGTKPISVATKPMTSDISHVKKPLSRGKPLQGNKWTIPSNTSPRMKEGRCKTETSHDNANTNTFKTEKLEEQTQILDETAREKRAYFQKPMTVAQIQNNVNGKKDCDIVEGSQSNHTSIVNILQELIDTEEQYVGGLKQIVNEYIPYIVKHLPTQLVIEITSCFEDIKDVYKKAEMFLESMKSSTKTADSIAEIFISHDSGFESYVLYIKNKPIIERHLNKFEDVIKEKERELKDESSLANYLLTPTQRLGQYNVLLQTLKSALEKIGKPCQKVDDAIRVVQSVLKKANDSLAISSIRDLPFASTPPGSLIQRSLFRILKPKNVTATVFLFENIIVFTEKVTKASEEFKHIGSISMSDVTLEECDNKQRIFKLTNYAKFKIAHPDATYVLEAEFPKIKNEWIRIIKDNLWAQFLKAKTAREHTDGVRFVRSRSCISFR